MALTARPVRAGRLGLLSASSFAVFLAVVVVLHFVQPELHPADLQGADQTAHGIPHDLAGFVAFFSLMPGAIVISRRLARANRLRGHYRRMSLLAWLLVPLFLAMMFVFGPFGVIGLGQRIFLGGVFAWLLLAAHGLRTGSFEAPGSRTSSEASGGPS